MNFIKKVPLPVCGTILGVAALGNLVQGYWAEGRTVCGVLAAIFVVLFLAKIIAEPKSVKENIDNPITCAVLGTFSMALMLLSVYIKPKTGAFAYVLWWFAIILHLVIIGVYTAKYMLKFNLKTVFSSIYIVYVGIAVAGVSCVAYNRQDVGAVSFWFGFITFVILLVIVTMRYSKLKEVPEPAKPIFSIYAAPASLCVAAYVACVGNKSFALLMGMYIVAFILYLVGLVNAVKIIVKGKFFPSYSAFTFPFVISGIATKSAFNCAAKMGHQIGVLRSLAGIQTIIAALFVLYVYCCYINFIIKNK